MKAWISVFSLALVSTSAMAGQPSAAAFTATANFRVNATFGSVTGTQPGEEPLVQPGDDPTAEGITLDAYPIDLSNVCNETFFRGSGPFGDTLYIMPRVSMSVAQRSNVQLIKGAKEGTFDLSFAIAIQSPKTQTRAPWLANTNDLIDDVAFQEDEPSNCDARQIGRQAAMAELRAKGYVVPDDHEMTRVGDHIAYYDPKNYRKPMFRKPYAVAKPAFNRIEIGVVGTSAIGVLAPQAGAVNLDNPRVPVTISLAAHEAKMVRAQMAQNGILVEVRFVVSSRPAEYLTYEFDGEKTATDLKAKLGIETKVAPIKFQAELSNALSTSNLTFNGRGDSENFVRLRDELVGKLMAYVLSDANLSVQNGLDTDTKKPAPIGLGTPPPAGDTSSTTPSSSSAPTIDVGLAVKRIANSARGTLSFLGQAKSFTWPAYILVKKGEYARDLYLAPTAERVEYLSSLSKGDQVFLSVKTGSLETILKVRDRVQQQEEEAEIEEWYRVNAKGLNPKFTPPLVICSDEARNMNWDDDPRTIAPSDEWSAHLCGDENPGVPVIVSSLAIDDSAMARNQKPGDAPLAVTDDMEYLRSVRSLLQNKVVRLAYRAPEAPMRMSNKPYQFSFGEEQFKSVFMGQGQGTVTGVLSSFLGFKFPAFGSNESTYSGVLGTKTSGPASNAVYYTKETFGTNYYTFGGQISTLMWHSTADLAAGGIVNPSIPIASNLKKASSEERRLLFARQVKLMVGLTGTDDMVSFADLVKGGDYPDFTAKFDPAAGGVVLTMKRDGASVYLYNFFTPRGNLQVKFPRLAAVQQYWNYDWNYNWDPINRWVRRWLEPKEDGDRLVATDIIPIGMKPVELPVERMNYLVNLRLLEKQKKDNQDLLTQPVSAIDKVIEDSKLPSVPAVNNQQIVQNPIKP